LRVANVKAFYKKQFYIAANFLSAA
jgi:hypothetical protein